MPDKHQLALRQVDQARSDLAAIAADLTFRKAQPARLPTRQELAHTALPAALTGSALLLTGIEALFR
jgi:ferric-dicitrate binding protein FerR (iron transport regulator)